MRSGRELHQIKLNYLHVSVAWDRAINLPSGREAAKLLVEVLQALGVSESVVQRFLQQGRKHREFADFGLDFADLVRCFY